MKKRYLVTYDDDQVNPAAIRDLFGVTVDEVRSDLVFEEVTNIREDDIFHFINMGISSVGLDEDKVKDYAQRSGVLAVEEDSIMYKQGFVTSQEKATALSTNKEDKYLWNIALVEAPKAWEAGFTGKGVNLAVLDTGIANHQDLTITGGVSCVPGTDSYHDGEGHGTHCAGIIAGKGSSHQAYSVAPDCNLYAVKVLDDGGSGQASWVIAGMEWCTRNNIQVASMSLGGQNAPQVGYGRAIKQCLANDVLVVCAAGNCYKPVPGSCAAGFPWVESPANSYRKETFSEETVIYSPIAVGAIDHKLQIAPFSSRGTNSSNWNPVTVAAPGVSIYSTYLSNGYEYLSGTSMACPHVAGLAALIMQEHSGATPQFIRQEIVSRATALGSAPYPNEPYGHGLAKY